jgi:hypothetical protein
MGDITTSCTFTKMVPAVGLSKYYMLVIEAPSTADANDTITFKKSVWGTVVGGSAIEVTTGSVESLAIVLSSDDYTITVGTGTNKARGYCLVMSLTPIA